MYTVILAADGFINVVCSQCKHQLCLNPTSVAVMSGAALSTTPPLLCRASYLELNLIMSKPCIPLFIQSHRNSSRNLPRLSFVFTNGKGHGGDSHIWLWAAGYLSSFVQTGTDSQGSAGTVISAKTVTPQSSEGENIETKANGVLEEALVTAESESSVGGRALHRFDNGEITMPKGK